MQFYVWLNNDVVFIISLSLFWCNLTMNSEQLKFYVIKNWFQFRNVSVLTQLSCSFNTETKMDSF